MKRKNDTHSLIKIIYHCVLSKDALSRQNIMLNLRDQMKSLQKDVGIKLNKITIILYDYIVRKHNKYNQIQRCSLLNSKLDSSQFTRWCKIVNIMLTPENVHAKVCD